MGKLSRRTITITIVETWTFVWPPDDGPPDHPVTLAPYPSATEEEATETLQAALTPTEPEKPSASQPPVIPPTPATWRKEIIQWLYIERPATQSGQAIRLVYHPGLVVALATLIEYAVATYGRERLPRLVAGLGQYDSWETLLPAVYGVSAAEFEAGWQAYWALHYGVSAVQP